MTYRKNTKLGRTEWVRLNDDESVIIVMIEKGIAMNRYTVQKSYWYTDWDLIYNAYSHCNAREFNEAYNEVKENI